MEAEVKASAHKDVGERGAAVGCPHGAHYRPEETTEERHMSMDDGFTKPAPTSELIASPRYGMIRYDRWCNHEARRRTAAGQWAKVSQALTETGMVCWVDRTEKKLAAY